MKTEVLICKLNILLVQIKKTRTLKKPIREGILWNINRNAFEDLDSAVMKDTFLSKSCKQSLFRKCVEKMCLEFKKFWKQNVFRVQRVLKTKGLGA